MSVTRHRYAVDGWGVGELWVNDDLVLAHEIDWTPPEAEKASSPLGGSSSPDGTIAGTHSRVGDGFVTDLLQRVHRLLGGRPIDFADVRLDLSWCTPFQRELAGALQTVPWGEVVSYGELAALAGRHEAPRAAGSFCAANRFALFLPCHRVVGATGIGGYGSAGIELKRRLLALEGIRL